jgi:hypothetical protein
VKSNRRITIAFALSVIAHTLLLATRMTRPLDQTLLGSTAPQPMTVEIVENEPRTAAEPTPPAPEPTPAPPPRPQPAPQPRIRPRIVEKAAEPAQPPEPTPPPPEPTSSPPLDMAAMVEARRAQRQAAQAAARATQPSNAPSEEEIALSRINRNLHSSEGQGVGGVFQILRKGTRTAEFAFNGWQPNRDRQWREVIEVDAGLNGDVDRAIVKRMIQLIRTHYSGDFRWESHRLSRIVILSARQEDNDGLEDFLIREFFGSSTPAQQ